MAWPLQSSDPAKMYEMCESYKLSSFKGFVDQHRSRVIPFSIRWSPVLFPPLLPGKVKRKTNCITTGVKELVHTDPRSVPIILRTGLITGECKSASSDTFHQELSHADAQNITTILIVSTAKLLLQSCNLSASVFAVWHLNMSLPALCWHC